MASPCFLALLLVGLAACATPKSRIERHQEAFDAYPPAVRESIRAGQAEVGFTRDQVELALGRPDRKYVRKTGAGVQDVWAYGASSARPGLSLGLGMGSGAGGIFSGGVGVDSGGDREDRARVVFQGDAVVSVEKLQK